MQKIVYSFKPHYIQHSNMYLYNDKKKKKRKNTHKKLLKDLQKKMKKVEDAG